MRTVNAHAVRADNPDSRPAGDLHQLRFQPYSLILAGLTETRRTEVNCPYSFFGAFFHKPGSSMGIDQADHMVDVARDVFEAGMHLMTLDLSSFRIDEVEGAVEFGFDKGIQEGSCPMPGVGSCDAYEGD